MAIGPPTGPPADGFIVGMFMLFMTAVYRGKPRDFSRTSLVFETKRWEVLEVARVLVKDASNKWGRDSADLTLGARREGVALSLSLWSLLGTSITGCSTKV